MAEPEDFHLTEHTALPGWVGCPGCGGPVNVRAVLERHTSDVLLAVLAALQERGVRDEELARRLERVAQAARELATASMQAHPFKAILSA